MRENSYTYERGPGIVLIAMLGYALPLLVVGGLLCLAWGCLLLLRTLEDTLWRERTDGPGGMTDA